LRKIVIRSFETRDGDRCVDIFQHEDLSFGFEIYRRDPEALTGWFPIGDSSTRKFSSQSAAHKVASKYAPWMPDDGSEIKETEFTYPNN